MSQKELGQSLSLATQTLRTFVNGDISAQDFVERYANFFYYEALDGHEPSSAQNADTRAKFWIAIDLHKRIQYEVINRLFLGSSYSPQELREAGRIDEVEARECARAICAEKGLDAILEALESA